MPNRSGIARNAVPEADPVAADQRVGASPDNGGDDGRRDDLAPHARPRPARRASRSAGRRRSPAGAERQHGEQHRPPDQHVQHDAGEPVHRASDPQQMHVHQRPLLQPPAERAAQRGRAASVSAASSRRSGAGRSAMRRGRTPRRCRSVSGSSGSNRPGALTRGRAQQPAGRVHRQAGDAPRR